MASLRQVWMARSLVALALATWAVSGLAADRAARAKANPAQAAEQVEMFAAIEQGRIAVKLFPKDSTICNVVVENKTKKPLSVKMPDAFAGVPILAQAGGIGGAGVGGGTSGRNSGGGNQGFGGGMGGMGMGGGMGGMGGMGMGGGMFNVPPERVAQAKVPIVCLEHGKDDPKPNVKYEIKPIDQFTTKTGVGELMQLLGTGAVPQRVAQAAAWHLNNDMSWQELAGKQLRFANGTRAPYFAPAEIQAAVKAATVAVVAAEQHKKAQPSSSSSSGNLSQN